MEPDKYDIHNSRLIVLLFYVCTSDYPTDRTKSAGISTKLAVVSTDRTQKGTSTLLDSQYNQSATFTKSTISRL